MGNISGLTFEKLLLDKDGALAGEASEVYPQEISDLIVISHGWHVDPDDADAWYRKLIGHLVTEASEEWQENGKTFGVLGVFWPSDQFRDDLSAEGFVQFTTEGAATGFGDLQQSALDMRAANLAAFLQIPEAEKPDFFRLVNRAAGGDGKDGDANELVAYLRAAVANGVPPDSDVVNEHAELLRSTRRDLVEQLALQGAPGSEEDLGDTGGGALGGVGDGGAPSGGAALGLLSGMTSGVARLLNQFAYYEMKKRAGLIGAAVGRRLAEEPSLADIRIHLVGHSFGARLVTAAAAVMEARKPKSLTLLQAAFSHNSFGVNITYLLSKTDGAFRAVVAPGRVDGPITITHTWHDTAVGLAYPAASRVSQTIASAIGVSDHFGGASDIFGALGANGAQNLKEGEGTFSPYIGDVPPLLQAHHVNNLHCDFIASHNDVGRIEVARILQSAFR